MSRCFPYPPPGYLRSDSRGVALIESIELQRENGKAKSELSKEKKRQRRERKKEKKESKKGKSFDVSNDADKKLSGEKLCQLEKSRDDMNGGCMLKGKKEAEQLESSSLTEEHGMPVSSQSVCYLSDGTQSSKKRKASPSDCSDHPGNIVRIKLKLRKHKEPDAIFSGEQSCSTSGGPDSHVQYKNTCIPDQKHCSSARQSVAIDRGEQSCSTSGRADSNVQYKENTCVPDQKQCSSARQSMAIVRGEQSCSTSGMADSHVQYKENTCQWSSAKQSVARLDKEKCCSDLAEVPALNHRAKSKQNKMQKTESLYRDLIQEWLPPPIQLGPQENLDDQDWLYRLRRENGNVSKGIAASQDVAQCRSPTLWPRAHYLPEANIYALPFTVPF